MTRILITGSNRGLGLGLVRACLGRGDTVFAACRRPATPATCAIWRKATPVACASCPWT